MTDTTRWSDYPEWLNGTPEMPVGSPEWCAVATDKIEGLTEDLLSAVKTAYQRGAVEWTRLNYPQWLAYIAAHSSAAAQGEATSTDDLVDRFAVALKAKLNAAAQKYGHDDAWLEDGWRDSLIAQMQEHVQKGDPRDVAAYCAFAWHHGWSITPPDTGDVAALREALEGAIAWDKARGYRMPYRVRDPLYSSLAALSKPNAPGREG